ncbi:hypothetical protein ACP3S7_10735 [Phytobacter ursingii]
MSFSDTQSAKRYAAIAEVAAAQAKIYAQELEEAPNYAAEAAASAEAAATSSSSASQYAGNAAEAATSASSSASAAAASAASAAGAAQSAIGQTVRAPQGETLSPMPAASSRQNKYIATDSSGGITLVDRSTIPVLDANGKLPVSTIPAIALTQPFVVSSQAAMLALDAQPGDIAKRTDLGYSFCLAASPASTLSNWIQLTDDVLAQLGLSSGATQVGATSLIGSSSTVQAELSKKPDSANLAASNGALAIGFSDTDSGTTTTVSGGLLSRLTKAAALIGNGILFGYQYASDALLRNVHDRLSEKLSILDYVQSGDAGDYSLALQRIFTKYVSSTGFQINIPSGSFSFKTQAVYNGTATVSIVGQQNTVLSLEFPVAGSNIAITTSGRIFLENFEISVTESTAVGLKTAFYLNCTTLDNSHHIRSVRATTTINTSGKGVLMFDLYNVSLGAFNECYIRYFGTYKSVAGSNNIAWRMQATSKISTDSMYKNCSVIGCEIPWLISPPVGGTGGAYLEGVTWFGCTIVDCLEGPYITGNNTNAYRSTMYRWIGGHINAHRRSFYAYWVSQVFISDAHIYLTYDSTSAPFGNYPIWLEQVTEWDVHDVSIHLFGQTSSDSHGVHVGPGCTIGIAKDIICFTPSAAMAVVSYPGSSRTRAGNCVVVYSGTAPSAAIALNGTQDLDLGNNTVYAA